MNHLLSTSEMTIKQVAKLFADTDAVAGGKIQTFPGAHVTTAFFEDSTRTRLSFELAAQKVGAYVSSFHAASSSLNKGESFRDTIQTLDAMGPDVLVIRHPAAGAPENATSWVQAAVINGGDGRHEHPTQALFDAYTIAKRLGTFDLAGVQVGIVGDTANSRVCHSEIPLFTMLGARVHLIAPPTMLPAETSGWDVEVHTDFDEILPKLNVVHMLRIQKERTGTAEVLSLGEFVSGYSLDARRLKKMPKDALYYHAGPLNRGVEIASDIADGPRSLVRDLVTNGVHLRTALLTQILEARRG